MKRELGGGGGGGERERERERDGHSLYSAMSVKVSPNNFPTAQDLHRAGYQWQQQWWWRSQRRLARIL